MSVVIAGGAGFIGSKLVEHFLAQGRQVLVIDNMCRGHRDFITGFSGQNMLTIRELDLADTPGTIQAMQEFHKAHPVEEVWHMAANSDIPAGIANAEVDLRDTFMTTFSLLQGMKALGLKRLAFASSSAIYGDHGATTVLHENTGPLLPISNYGAMKLASEALISAAAESFLEKACIFRFPNVVGIPATHGVIRDFIRKLKATPATLQVLGNGTQQKAYLHVAELLAAMLFIMDKAPNKIDVYNIGPCDSGCTVAKIAEAVVARVSPGAVIEYGTEGRGWVGDVPRFTYSVEKLADLGWKTRYSSIEAVKRAVDEIAMAEGA